MGFVGFWVSYEDVVGNDLTFLVGARVRFGRAPGPQQAGIRIVQGRVSV